MRSTARFYAVTLPEAAGVARQRSLPGDRGERAASLPPHRRRWPCERDASPEYTGGGVLPIQRGMTKALLLPKCKQGLTRAYTLVGCFPGAG
jgi:hypothetical protein